MSAKEADIHRHPGTNPETLAVNPVLRLALLVTAQDMDLYNRVLKILQNTSTREQYMGAIQQATGEVFATLAQAYLKGTSAENPDIHILSTAQTNALLSVLCSKTPTSERKPSGKAFKPNSAAVRIKEGQASIMGFIRSATNLQSTGVRLFAAAAPASLDDLHNHMQSLTPQERQEIGRNLSADLTRQLRFVPGSTKPLMQYATLLNSRKSGFIKEDQVIRLPLQKGKFYDFFKNVYVNAKPTKQGQ